MKAPLPTNERERLAALDELRVLDTLPEESFDSIVRLAAKVCEAPIALFSLVDDDRQWFKARYGIDVEETPRAVSFCAHAVHRNELLVVEDATKDPDFLDNALVISGPEIRFYAGAPVRAGKSLPLGTLCIIDNKARSLAPREAELLMSLAREIEAQLELRKALIASQLLQEERAVLVKMFHHDAAGMLESLRWNLLGLRDKLPKETAIDDGLRMLTQVQKLCEGVQRLAVGQGVRLSTTIETVDLRPWARSVMARAKGTAKRAGVELVARVELSDSVVETDLHLLERVVTNVYLNAIQSCAPGDVVRLSLVDGHSDEIVFTAEDSGPGVKPEDAQRIFEPFFSVRPVSGKHSGLGLAFCRMAMDALGGAIAFAPGDPKGARFTITLRRHACHSAAA